MQAALFCNFHPVFDSSLARIHDVVEYKSVNTSPPAARRTGGLLETPPLWHATIYTAIAYKISYVIRPLLMYGEGGTKNSADSPQG